MSKYQDSLYVFLRERGVNMETLSLIKEFYEGKWKTHRSNVYPNKYDADSDLFPFGRHKTKSFTDSSIPRRYISWCLSQKELGSKFPLFYNRLKKYVVESYPALAKSQNIIQE